MAPLPERTNPVLKQLLFVKRGGGVQHGLTEDADILAIEPDSRFESFIRFVLGVDCLECGIDGCGAMRRNRDVRRCCVG